nr:unnamed protein product [Timema tahoe]
MRFIDDKIKSRQQRWNRSRRTLPSSLSQPALKQVRCNLAPRISVSGSAGTGPARVALLLFFATASAVTGPEQSCSFVLPEIFWSSRTVERKWIL